MQRLAEAVIHAHRFAREERVLTGYLVLYGGWMAVEGAAASWAASAARLWAQALAEYKTCYPRNWGDLD